MNTKLKLILGSLLALTFTSSALAQSTQSSGNLSSTKVTARKQPKSSGIMPTRMMINGVRANIAISNKKLLKQALKDYKADNVLGLSPKPTLEELIENIEEANLNSSKKVPGMTGYGGIMGHIFLEAARKAISSGDNYDRQKRVEITLRGQIENYKYNSVDGSGSIVSVTYIDRTVIPSGNGTPNTKTEAFRWHVDIDAGGFVVHEIGAHPTTDPFPGTMPFTQPMIDRLNSLGFKYKLWANGVKINVRKIEHKRNIQSKKWDDVGARVKYKKLLGRDPDNCIDMMFVERPPADLTGMGPPMYCLGRCGNPMLVNTGM